MVVLLSTEHLVSRHRRPPSLAMASPNRKNKGGIRRSTTAALSAVPATEQVVVELVSPTRSVSELNNPRSFPLRVKQECWEKADKVKGRDPDRWRKDSLGNLLFRKLVGCPGCLCHDYDHIIPFSKGGQSTIDNCQVLQTRANRAKSDRMNMSKADLIQKSSYCKVSGRDKDLLEMAAYGNVRHSHDSSGCSIQ